MDVNDREAILLLLYRYNVLVAASQVWGMQQRMTALKKIQHHRKQRIVQQRQETINAFCEKYATRCWTLPCC